MKRLAVLILAVAAVSISSPLMALTYVAGSDPTGVGYGTEPLSSRADTGRGWCAEAATGPTIVLPTGATATLNACSTSTIAATDICTNTAGGCLLLDTATKISTSVVPDLSGTYAVASSAPAAFACPSGSVCGGKTDATTSTATATGTGTFYATRTAPLSMTYTATNTTTVTATNWSIVKVVKGGVTAAQDATPANIGAVATNASITPATHSKITYDAKGLVTSGADITASDLPAHATSHVTGSDQLSDATTTMHGLESAADKTKLDSIASGAGVSYWTASGNDIHNNNAGNVGIGTGTATPISKLYIQTNGGINGYLKAANGVIARDTANVGNGEGVGLTFSQYEDANLTYYARIASKRDGGGTNSALNFIVRYGVDSSDFSSSNVKMIILSSGKVGIGTTAPTELLSLGLAGTTQGVLSLAGNTSGKIIIQPQAAAGSYTLTLPNSVIAGDALHTDGSGNLSWVDDIPTSQKAAANGVATLDGATKVPVAQLPVGTTAGTVAAGDDSRITGAIQSGFESPRTIYYSAYVASTLYGLGPDGSSSTSSHAQSVTSTPAAIAVMNTTAGIPYLRKWPRGVYTMRLWANMASANASVYYTVGIGSTVIATSSTFVVTTGSLALYEITATDSTGYHRTSSSTDYLSVTVYASSASTNNITIGYGGTNATHVSVPWTGFTNENALTWGGASPGSSRICSMSDHVHPAQTHVSDDLNHPSTVCVTGQFLTTNGTSDTSICATPTSGSATGYTCSGSCTSPQFASFYDGTHLTPAPYTPLAIPSAAPNYCVTGTALTSYSPGQTQCISVLTPNGQSSTCTKPTFVNGQMTSCAGATYADVGADASGAATSAVNTAINGSSGYIPYFTSAHAIAALAQYFESPHASSIPISNTYGNLNWWVAGTPDSTAVYLSDGTIGTGARTARRFRQTYVFGSDVGTPVGGGYALLLTQSIATAARILYISGNLFGHSLAADTCGIAINLDGASIPNALVGAAVSSNGLFNAHSDVSVNVSAATHSVTMYIASAWGSGNECVCGNAYSCQATLTVEEN